MLLLKDSLELPAPQHYKYITSISKNVYIDKLDDIVYKHNNTYHNKTKIKSFDVKLSKYIDSSKEISDKDPKFKVDDIVRISKWKNIFAKGYVPNRSEKIFLLRKLKKMRRGHMLIVILKAKIMLEYSTKNNYKKQIKKSLELKKQ